MKISTGKGYISLFALLAIWLVSAVTSLPGLAISPILEDLSRIFPSASQLEVQMLTSLPSLLIIPFVLFSGWFSGGSESLKLLAVGLFVFFASGAVCIFFDVPVLIMLRAIQLDNQKRFVAKEMSNVVANNFLTAESGLAKTQTVVPQVTLFFRHILTQRLCQGQQFIVAR